MADNPEKSVLIDQNIFLKTYSANVTDYEQFKTDVAEQLRLGLKFDKASTPVSLNTAIETYKVIRDGLYLNKAQQVSLDYKDAEGKTETKPIYLTKEDYLKLKLLSAMDDQDKVIKAYQRLQDLILGNQFLLKNNQLEPSIFTFEMYRDRVLGLFDTLQGDIPNKIDQLMKGYQKSYEESMEILEDLITSRNPLRSGYYRMYNQNDEVRTTVDAFKRAVLEKAAIEANENSEFKQMQLGLMKLLQYGSLDERLRKQILLLIKQNAEGVATVTGGAKQNYAAELNNLLNQWGFTPQQIQKPIITSLTDTIKLGLSKIKQYLPGTSNVSSSTPDAIPASPTSSIVTDDYLKQLEKDLSNLSQEVTNVVDVLNPALPEDQLKLKMYEELLVNLEFLLDLIMDIKLASVNSDVQLKQLYENLKKALKNVMDETKSLNQSNQEIKELMIPIAKAMEDLTNLPEGTAMLSPVAAPNQVAPDVSPNAGQIEASQQLTIAKETLDNFNERIKIIKNYYNDDKINQLINLLDIKSKKFNDNFIKNEKYYNEKEYNLSRSENDVLIINIKKFSKIIDEKLILPLIKSQLAILESYDKLTDETKPEALKEAIANANTYKEVAEQFKPQIYGETQQLDNITLIDEFIKDVEKIKSLSALPEAESPQPAVELLSLEKEILPLAEEELLPSPKEVPSSPQPEVESSLPATYEQLQNTHTIKNVPSDGWCFFYAVNGALGLPYNQFTGDYKVAAKNLIDAINYRYYLNHLTSEKTNLQDNLIYRNADNMLNGTASKVWATDKEMQLITDTLDICIYIYLQYSDEKGNTQFYDTPVIFSRQGINPCEGNTIYLSLSIGEIKIGPEDNLIQILNKSTNPTGNHFYFFQKKTEKTPQEFEMQEKAINKINAYVQQTNLSKKPIGRNPALSLPPLRSNPLAETEKSPKEIIQDELIELLKSKLPEFSTRLDPKFTVNELNSLVSGLSNEKANLLRIAFIIANIQENVESKDRDMDGLTSGFFSKMISYFEKSRLSTAYYNNLDSTTIQNEMKQIQIDLYCMLVDQLYALHQTTGAVYTYAANTERRNFKSIDSRGIDLILLDTILPKFNKDEVYMPSYLGAVQTYKTLDIYLRDLGDVLPTFDGMLQNHFTVLKIMDNHTNRRNFLTGCIDYLVNKKYRDSGEAKQILYKLLFGRDSWGSYAERMSWGGDDINLSDEIKDMDGGANVPAQPIQLDKLKEAIQKLDEYRKTLRSTQEELNSWKEKYATYNKSVDITKNFKGDKVIDSETIQMIKLFVEDLESAYNNVITARLEENTAFNEFQEMEALAKEAIDVEVKASQALSAAETGNAADKEKIPERKKENEEAASTRAVRAEKRDKLRDEVEPKKKARETAEKTFTEQLKAFLENKFAYTDANAGKVMEMFVSSLRKALPGELKGVSNDINGLSKQLLSIQNLMMKLTENTKESNYYIDSEIVSIYEFLKGKSADLKKFNTERFNAMDKTIRSIYEFILTTNKPLESKEKFKTKRLEFEALLDGTENVADEQRFKDLIIDPKKKNVKGLIPTIKDIKRLLETDIDYFTSLFQQKATSILKEQELRRQQEELQVRRAQPGPFAALFGQQPGMKVPGGSQSGGADIDKDNRIKLDYYFGIKKQEAGKEEEEYKQYKDVQLYLDAFNKLIDSYKFSLTTVTDPAAALALSGDKSLFNMIYDKYVKSSEDENKGEFIASQELATSLETNNLIPRNVLRVSMRDRIIILFTTLFMRLITLSIVEFMIEKGVLKNLKYTLLAYLGFFSILFIAFTALVNLDMYRLRIVFNYLNFHANSDKVYSYIILLWTFGAIIYYIITNVNQDINVTNTSEDVKARLIYRIQVVSLIVWLFLTIMVFIF